MINLLHLDPHFFLEYLDEKYNDLDYSKLNQKDYPCKLVFNRKDESGFQVKDDLHDFFCMYPPEDWLVADCDVFDSLFDYDCEVSIMYVPLWQDYNKYCGEDESNMLRFLNRLKISAFRDGNPLTKTIMFFVLG